MNAVDDLLTRFSSDSILDKRYRIRRAVARGGWGVVFEAEHIELCRRCAIKICLGKDEPPTRWLLREGVHLARASHPNILAVWDAGRLDDGRGYLVTEWIEGVELATLMTHDALGLSDALLVAVTLASALRVLHKVGIVHRDLKPGNVMVPMVDGCPHLTHLRLIDVGIGRALSTTRWDRVPVTISGKVSGTPAYMAPEQLTGRRETVATDMYGLGALLYEMIFRCPPMGAMPLAIAVPADKSAPELPFAFLSTGVVKRLTEEVRIPDNPVLPDGLRELIDSMLRRDPTSRPQSLDDVIERLEAIRRASMIHVGAVE